VAQDEAFCFYYADNLDALQRAGAELVRFSPLRDDHLPEALNALCFGGGYPEVWAQMLSANVAMPSDVAAFIGRSGPTYAECGGLMYLAESLRSNEGEMRPMVGALPISVVMTERLQRFGYVEVTFTRDCLLGTAGTTARGHSFHYSTIASCSNALSRAYQLEYPRRRTTETEGFSLAGILASYVHIHFKSNPDLANAFVQHAVSGGGRENARRPRDPQPRALDR
jgi:cobyrinic acid a,c-diamide synthase